MNILYISSKKNWGGVTTWMGKTAVRLEERGHKVWIVAHPDGRFACSAPRTLKLIPRKLGMDYNPWTIAFLIDLIRREGIDVVVTNIEKEVIAGGIAARICKIPNVRRVGREDDFNKRFKVKLHHRLLVDRCIVPCNDVRDRAMRRAGWLDAAQFTTIYNGKNGKHYPAGEIEQQRREWKRSSDDFIIGVTSQLSPVKGIDRLIQVFSDIGKKYPDTYLVITGEGKEKETYRELARNLLPAGRVIFAGFNSDPMRAAAAYDIAVSNSIVEGFPNTVVEYFAMGRPVVVADAGGVSEIAVHGENAWVIPCKHDDALHEGLETLILDSDLRKRLGETARETVMRGFTEDLMVEKLERFFRETIGLV